MHARFMMPCTPARVSVQSGLCVHACVDVCNCARACVGVRHGMQAWPSSRFPDHPSLPSAQMSVADSNKLREQLRDAEEKLSISTTQVRLRPRAWALRGCVLPPHGQRLASRAPGPRGVASPTQAGARPSPRACALHFCRRRASSPLPTPGHGKAAAYGALSGA